MFKDGVGLQKRKLDVQCGFWAREECRFGADCKRARTGGVGVKTKSVALGEDVCAGTGGKARSEAVAKAGSGNGRATTKRMVGKGVGRGESVADMRPYVFGIRK